MAPRRLPRSPRLLVAVVVLALALLTGCSDPEDADAFNDPTSDSTPAPDEIVAPDEAARLVADGAVLLDVRTPEEFADGHLEDARNVDLESDDFRERAEQLDPDESYVVYCATGNRAGQAVEIMREIGIGDAVNAGGYDDLRGVLG